MAGCRNEAVEVVNRLNQENRIDYSDYLTIMDGLQEINTLRDRDEELEELWAEFSDVPVNPKTKCIEAPFMEWGVGISREKIWHWFDRRHSKGVGYLLYGAAIDRQDQLAKLAYTKQLCTECESVTCQYNHGGECRFVMVHERKPRINDWDGCIDYDYQEGEG